MTKSNKKSSRTRVGALLGTVVLGLVLGGLALGSLGTPPSASSAAATPEATDAPPKAIPSMAEIQRRAQGVSVGADAAGPFYVFFDTQCPHCATLYRELEPLHASAKFIWVPVGVLSKFSVRQGATILGAPDPLAALQEHEKLMAKGPGGLAARKDPSEASVKVMQSNTEVFRDLQARAVPFVVGLHAKTGLQVTHLGSGTTAQMAKLLGLPLP